MTEGDWLESSDPQEMVRYLAQGVGSERKLRLFGCACCRQVWDLLKEECFREAVETAERFADGLASGKELAIAKKVSGAALERNGLAGVTGPRCCASGSAWSCTRNAQTAAMYPLWVFTDEAQRQWEILFIRDIFGNPFGPRPPSDATWLKWNDGTVVKLAQGIYDERAFDRLPILADALEEAGCTNADILAHCREPGEHVRGCWVLDLLLGKS
jgi:hypothetical protein